VVESLPHLAPGRLWMLDSEFRMWSGAYAAGVHSSSIQRRWAVLCSSRLQFGKVL